MLVRCVMRAPGVEVCTTPTSPVISGVVGTQFNVQRTEHLRTQTAQRMGGRSGHMTVTRLTCFQLCPEDEAIAPTLYLVPNGPVH